MNNLKSIPVSGVISLLATQKVFRMQDRPSNPCLCMVKNNSVLRRIEYFLINVLRRQKLTGLSSFPDPHKFPSGKFYAFFPVPIYRNWLGTHMHEQRFDWLLVYCPSHWDGTIRKPTTINFEGTSEYYSLYIPGLVVK